METFAEKPVIVAGAGRSGLLAARLLAGEGARVTLRDDRSRADVEASLCEPIPAGIAFLRGMPGEEEVRGSALLVVSPGVPRERLPLSALAAAGVPVWGELELGFRRFQGKVAAITGTNGKSTVTTLVGGMASGAFPRVFVGGNLGTPFVAAAGAPCDWGVVEVSSFQLESIGSFRPRVAALLNLTEDHRDRYAAKEAYFEAKMAVFRNQGPSDTAVVNADDPEVTARLGSIRARLLPFSVSRALEEGAFLSGGEMVLRTAFRERSAIPGRSLRSPACRTWRTPSRRSPSPVRWRSLRRPCWRSSRGSRDCRTGWSSSDRSREFRITTIPRGRTWAPSSPPSTDSPSRWC